VKELHMWQGLCRCLGLTIGGKKCGLQSRVQGFMMDGRPGDLPPALVLCLVSTSSSFLLRDGSDSIEFMFYRSVPPVLLSPDLYFSDSLRSLEHAQLCKRLSASFSIYCSCLDQWYARPTVICLARHTLPELPRTQFSLL
jgi:hypothetical protein